MRFQILSAFLTLSLLAGCACPDIVDTREIGDDKKTCARLNQEIEQCSKTKKEVEARYRELLTRATSVEEILKIEEQIGNIRTEIESAEGRLRYLSNQVQYSTLHVTFYEKYSNFGFWNKIQTIQQACMSLNIHTI